MNIIPEQRYGVRCPSCERDSSYTLRWWLDNRFARCVFCGHSLSKERNKLLQELFAEDERLETIFARLKADIVRKRPYRPTP